jgi:hypothetical protein
MILSEFFYAWGHLALNSNQRIPVKQWIDLSAKIFREFLNFLKKGPQAPPKLSNEYLPQRGKHCLR